MKIGEVAAGAGVSIDAIRYYERRGILKRAARTESGYRSFDAAVVDRLRLVRKLQDLGFRLDEVVEALHAHDEGGATCASERWRLVAVEERIDAKIAQLRQTKSAIRRTLATCDSGHCALSTR
jgi:DNA-binding transcriptional MerR regulator